MVVTKMHANGNDFCVVSYEMNTFYDEIAKMVCDRRLGIGADGLIVVKYHNKFEIEVYNPNGELSSINGNAVRCATKYLYDLNLVNKKKLSILARDEIVNVEIINNEPFECLVNMGKPNLKNQMIYANDSIDCFGRIIDIDGIKITVYSFYLANVQTVIFVDDLNNHLLDLAEKIHSYRLFARKTNVNFVKIKNKQELEVKTYERNNGFVLASGSGCCAAAYAAYKLGKVANKIRCYVSHGYLDVEIKNKDEIILKGPAEKVFVCDIKEDK